MNQKSTSYARFGRELRKSGYQPAGKGKIERFFRTLRAAWLRHLTPEATASLDTLNRTLWAWVEGEYHQSPHRGLDGRTPLDQWALAGHDVRYPDRSLDLDDLFLFEAKRRVMKDRTVSLHGRLYEVDAVLVSETVTLRYDPDAPPSRPIEVVHDGKCAGLATRLDAYANNDLALSFDGQYFAQITRYYVERRQSERPCHHRQLELFVDDDDDVAF